MDIIQTPPYNEMQELYSKYFSLGNISRDITEKFALISLVCYIVRKLQLKKPDVTHYQIIKKLADINTPEDFIKGVAVVCSDFGYGCENFPTFGIEDKQIPAKIKELLSGWLPF